MGPKSWVKIVTTAGVIAGIYGFIPSVAMAQRSGTTPVPSGGTTGTSTGIIGGTTGTTGRPTTPTTTTTNPNNTQGNTTIQPPIYVSGRVMLEDGTPPPGQVVLETVCNGQGHSEGYTDSKGYFSIQLGQRNAIIQDASEYGSRDAFNNLGLAGTSSSSNGIGNSQAAEHKYMGCDLQAKVAGYRSQTVSLTGRRAMDDPNVGTILMHRIGPAEEGKTVSLISLAAPRDAKKAYDKGMDAVKKKKFGDAQASFEKAVEAYPKYATAWYELGMIQAGQDKLDMARKYFDKAVECDPKFVAPYRQITVLELLASNWRALADTTATLLKLDPFDFPDAFFYNAVANFNLQNVAAAEKSALEAERLDTRHVIPKNSQLLGVILASKKDYAGAAEHFKAYLKFAPDASDAAKVRSQLAEVEKITAASAENKEQ